MPSDAIDIHSRTKESRKRDSVATRAAILEAALNEFAEKGLAGARVSEIANRTDTSKHMIYYHFGNKEGLYVAALEATYSQFRLAEGAINYPSLSPENALKELVGATFDIHATNPKVVRVVMGENLNHGTHIRKLDCFEQRQIALDTLSSILERGAKTGAFTKGLNSLQIHLSISALCFHYVANHYTFGHVFDYDATSISDLDTRRQEVIVTILNRCLSR